MPARNGAWRGSKWIRPERRLAIYHRDGFACVWCGASAPLCLDHLWRPSADGRYDNRSSSLVTACKGCNDTRGSMRLARWLRLLRKRGVDVSSIVRVIRPLVWQPVDIALGRALRADRAIRRAQREAGLRFQREDLPALKESSCEPPF